MRNVLRSLPLRNFLKLLPKEKPRFPLLNFAILINSYFFFYFNSNFFCFLIKFNKFYLDFFSIIRQIKSNAIQTLQNLLHISSYIREISIPHKINKKFPKFKPTIIKNAKKRRRRFPISLIFSLKTTYIGGFGGSRSSRSRSTSQSPPRPAPKYTPAPAQQAPQRGGMMSGLGGMVMTGMALGAGSEIAHQGVRGLMGGI